MRIYRHGDVLIKQVESVPSEAKKVSSGKELTLALGEVTGHHHTMYAETPNGIVNDYMLNGTRYIEVIDKFKLLHQEHDKIYIEPGIYEIGDEREWDYIDNEFKKVID